MHPVDTHEFENLLIGMTRIMTYRDRDNQITAIRDWLRERTEPTGEMASVTVSPRDPPAGARPCPDCGGSTDTCGGLTGMGDRDRHWIACQGDCHMAGPARRTQAEAVAAWNRIRFAGERGSAVSREATEDVRDVLDTKEVAAVVAGHGTIPMETSMSDFTPDPPRVCYGDPEAEARERYRGHRDTPARPDDHDLPERKDTVITIWMSHPRDPYPSFAYRQHCIERYVVMPFGWALTHDDTHGVVCADLKGTRSTAATVLMNAERLALGFRCRVAP